MRYGDINLTLMAMPPWTSLRNVKYKNKKLFNSKIIKIIIKKKY